MKYLERNECYEAVEQLRTLLGDETVINYINDYFSSDEVSGFVQSLANDYDINLSVVDDEEEEDE